MNRCVKCENCATAVVRCILLRNIRKTELVFDRLGLLCHNIVEPIMFQYANTGPVSHVYQRNGVGHCVVEAFLLGYS